MSAKQSERILVSVSGNRCLVPWSINPVDASDSFDTILDVESMRLYKKGHYVIDKAWAQRFLVDLVHFSPRAVGPRDKCTKSTRNRVTMLYLF